MKKNTIIIGIAGASASGKSLLANTIVSELGSDQVVVIPEDSYYKEQSDLSLEERAFVNYDHPDAFDHDLLCKHLESLQMGKAVELPLYDYTLHTRSKQTRTIGSHKIIVLEGIMLLVDPTLRKLLDIRIFMDAPLDICLLRRIQRDVVKRGRTIDSVIEQYEANVRPMFLQFIEPSKRYADIIVPRGGENRIAIDMIKAKMHNLLNGIG